MDYQIGDIVEVNFNGCLWHDLPSMECEIISTNPNNARLFLLKLPNECDPGWRARLTMERKDVFTCHRDWFRLVSNKPVQVDVANLL